MNISGLHPHKNGEYKHSLETRIKMGILQKGKKKPWISIRNQKLTEEKALNWKGDKVRYRTLHKWVEKHLGKANKCMKNLRHTSTRYHWANISHTYKRDLSDWIQMCPSCNGKDRVGRRVSP